VGGDPGSADGADAGGTDGAEAGSTGFAEAGGADGAEGGSTDFAETGGADGADAGGTGFAETGGADGTVAGGTDATTGGAPPAASARDVGTGMRTTSPRVTAWAAFQPFTASNRLKVTPLTEAMPAKVSPRRILWLPSLRWVI
jgi:hypothetical protein